MNDLLSFYIGVILLLFVVGVPFYFNAVRPYMKGRGPKRITLRKYLSLPESKRAPYELLIDSVLAVKKIKVRDGDFWAVYRPRALNLWKLPYSVIIEIKDAISQVKKGETTEAELNEELIRIMYRVPASQLHNIDCIAYFNCTTWIVEQMADILTIEAQQLGTEEDPKLKAAGIDKLDAFGHWPTIKFLTEKTGQSFDQVLATPYDQIFTDLCYYKAIGDINKKLIKDASKQV